MTNIAPINTDSAHSDTFNFVADITLTPVLIVVIPG